MAVYNQVLQYTFRDSLASGNPQKIIFGAYLDGEFGAIHTASLDAMSLAGNNSVQGNNTFTGLNSFSGTVTFTNTTAQYVLNNSGATTNQTNTIVRVGTSGGLAISSATDAAPTTFVTNALVLARSGTAFTSVSLGNSTDNPAFSFVGTGTATFNGPVAASSSTGVALTVNGAASNTALVINPSTTSVGLAIVAASGNNATINLRGNGNSGSAAGVLYQDTSNIVHLANAGNAGVDLDTNGSTRLAVSGAGNVAISAPASGNALNITSVSGALGVSVSGASSDAARIALTDGNTGTRSWQIRAGGSATGVLDFFDATRVASTLQIGTTGDITVVTPSGGTAMTVNGVANQTIGSFVSGSSATSATQDISISRAGSTANSIQEGPNLTLVDSTNSTNTCLQMSGGQTELYQFNGGWNQIWKVTTGRGLVINPPASANNALTSTGVAGSLAASLIGSSTSGSSFGLGINAGTTSADYGIVITNQSSSSTYFKVQGNGVVLGNDLAGNNYELGYRGTPINAQTGAGYTLIATDRGKIVFLESGFSGSLTIPSGVFSAGDVVSIAAFNGTTSYTIAQGSGLSLFWGNGSNTTGNRTITSVSMATVVFQTSSACIISGGGLS